MSNLRGVILAGGLGARLSPLTKITNKHLLPVWDRPMICYPIENLVKSGIKEILIVTGGQYAGGFLNFLRNGKELGISRLQYAYQEGNGGIADALKLARDFVEDSLFCVMLGDNIYQFNIKQHATAFEAARQDRPKGYAAVLGTAYVSDPREQSRFGVAFQNDRGQLVNLVEKPSKQFILEKTSQGCTATVITGTYFYGPEVFAICDRLAPSTRGELEITEVSDDYASHDNLDIYMHPGYWSDAGTIESLHTASHKVKVLGANENYGVS
jgi:glucose-1-phosphate thymidylyltransferase